MRKFLRFLFLRFWLGSRNVGWGQCTWGHRAGHAHRPILLDERMCHECYWSDYVVNYK